jgi:uncharacterized damage-inducible protein DinB
MFSPNKPDQSTMSNEFISTQLLFEQWRGHRSLTRSVINAFPEDSLFTFSIGGMRPFAVMAMEVLRMAAQGLRSAITGKWHTWEELETMYPMPETKTELLRLWDEATVEINYWWERIPVECFAANITMLAGQYEGPPVECPISVCILYLVDNEVHHRAQGYVYLRSQGIEPPMFWDRK